MSRIAKKPISIPDKSTVSVEGGRVLVKGPLGELSRPLHPNVAFAIEGNSVTVTPKRSDLATKALWGTQAAHLKNMIEGVTKGFEVKLEIEGVGYRFELAGGSLKLAIGFSHPVILAIPEGVSAKLEKAELTLSGNDKEKVTQFAAIVRGQKKPEPYKGKGIHYKGEVVRRKQGKKTV